MHAQCGASVCVGPRRIPCVPHSFFLLPLKLPFAPCSVGACCSGRSCQVRHDVHAPEHRNSVPHRQRLWTAEPHALTPLAYAAQERTMRHSDGSRSLINDPARRRAIRTRSCTHSSAPMQRSGSNTSDTISCASWEKERSSASTSFTLSSASQITPFS